MKIEKLRKNHKKEIIIGTILTVVIGGALTYRLTHSKYRTTQSINLATGVINYTVPNFKIMAMYKNDGSGDVSIDSMPISGYVINEEKTYCTTDNTTQVKGKIKTVNGNHVISGMTKSDKCYLYFDKIKITNVDSLIANLTINNYSPTFKNLATTDEGVFQTSDGMYGGTTYYWRGAATTNHVIFANKCWRIVRINGDKTMRLIHNGTPTSGTCADFGSGAVIMGSTDAEKYYSTSGGAYNNASYVGWTYSLESQRTIDGTDSNAKVQTEKWYKTNILDKGFDEKVADGKYCNDRDTGEKYSGWSGPWTTQWSANGAMFAYAGVDRLYNKYSPTFNCPSGDVYTLKVGLITADEVEFAGGVYGQTNGNYYLKGDNHYWTMSPFNWYDGHASVFAVASSGYHDPAHVNDARIGLRPVINLKADTTFASGGTGTQNNPYVVQ